MHLEFQLAGIQLAGSNTNGTISDYLPFRGCVRPPAFHPPQTRNAPLVDQEDFTFGASFLGQQKENSTPKIYVRWLMIGNRTVLITVLTNSFMSIASNAKEEHQ